MALAMDQARLAATRDEVPVGAVIANSNSGEILAACGNETIARNDPTAHAEIMAIRAVCDRFKTQRIPECDLYVTLEPCPMCAAAISFARIRHVYFGASDEKSGGFVSGPALASARNLHHKPDFTAGIRAEESAALLRDFFRTKRQDKARHAIESPCIPASEADHG